MHYFEVAIADKRYHSDAPLTYSHDQKLPVRSVVSVPLQKWLISGFVTREVAKPKFAVKPIKAVMSQSPIPAHNLKLAAATSFIKLLVSRRPSSSTSCRL